MISKAIDQLKQLKLSELAINFTPCYLCSWPLQIKFYNNEMGVRCAKCGASAVSQMLGKEFKRSRVTNHPVVYELSSRGAFVRFLQRQGCKLTLSEYFDGIPSGELHGEILCQNVEKLSFPDQSFDICTSLEVFEHVENDLAGFREIHRVLKVNGVFIFTAPINLEANTVERTEIIAGKRINTMPPEFHSDSLNGVDGVFCYRNYGLDIVSRLKRSGFNTAQIITPEPNVLFGFGRSVILATKASSVTTDS
ncbi:MAG: class I SAM-dependent methyltransferase [Proteobacteria bacterium]|nr:class I SAM-dependent methyltransferase [Pseudomonadota bacterium]